MSSAPMTPPHGTRLARTGRAAELGLLVFAAVIVTSAMVLVELNQNRSLTWDLAWYGGGYLVSLLITHLAVRRFAPYADPVLMPVAALLNGIGLVMIHRLDLGAVVKALADDDPAPSAQAPLQLVWTGIALLLFVIVLAVIRDHTVLQQYAYTIALVGLVFMALPAVLPSAVAPDINGAKIWLRIPGVLSIQPAEFAKVALIIFSAAFLTSKIGVLRTAGKRFLGLQLPRIRDLGPVVLALAVSLAILVRGSDLGTSLLLFGTLLVMIYLASSRASWLIIGLLAFAGGATLMYRLFSHVRVRVDIWLHPFANPNGNSYQLVQSLFGLGTGGIFGTGLGGGRPNTVPYASSDFIIAALGEELGLVGLTVIIVLYMVLTGRGLRTAMAVKDTFGSLFAGGLAFSLALQVFIIIGGVTRLIPLTGLTTPFLSYGGSSLLANYVILALLMRISDSSRRPSEPVKPKPTPLIEARTEMVPVAEDGAS